jgi:DNA-binding response OmpR family regulator
MAVPGSRESCSPPPVSERPCVLVVDDDDDTVRPIVRLLELHGYTAQGASGFHAAIDAWTTSGCDILVADIALPDGSGLDLMRRLRPGGVRGVSVSGHDDPAHVNASRDAGFSAHFVKPVRFDDLLAAVERLS